MLLYRPVPNGLSRRASRQPYALYQKGDAREHGMDERRLPAASSEEVRSADIEVERMCFGIVGLIEAALGYVDERSG